MTTKNIINLTPHNVTLRTESAEYTWPASDSPARVSQTLTDSYKCRGDDPYAIGLPCSERTFGAIEGLPPFRAAAQNEQLTHYIVSTIVFEAARAAGRCLDDLLVPDSGPDAFRVNGQVVAVRRFIVAPHHTA